MLAATAVEAFALVHGRHDSLLPENWDVPAAVRVATVPTLSDRTS
jgi:hypothetical protein